jgi:hypothetical protein
MPSDSTHDLYDEPPPRPSEHDHHGRHAVFTCRCGAEWSDELPGWDRDWPECPRLRRGCLSA